MKFPDPTRTYPVSLPGDYEIPGTVFLSQVIDHPRFSVGRYTYASDFGMLAPSDWAGHLAPYLFEDSRDYLRIGMFCQIAHGVKFITSGANHAMDGLSTYPFPIFDPDEIGRFRPDIRDTVVGHDVWLGYGAVVCPGARIGNGVIVGAGAVVRGTVPDYAVVTGNPAQVGRMRFPPDVVDKLLALEWWRWPAERIKAAVPALMSGDMEALARL
mmetsp:Transcript_28712/g.54287  ORF Transcript_28712/g.54287 Transcript_28712/m.54287 type:complete len:213 (-) Transcript_28712:1156-1794(-)